MPTLNATDFQNKNALSYQELTDEHITDIKVGIEKFIKTNEYWDKFVRHSKVNKGHRTFQSRAIIAPKVKESDIKPRAEFVAPRPSKFGVKTMERTVENYGDKFIYSKEDIQFHFDDTVANGRATLQEIAVQKLDFIKGKAFFATRAIVTPVEVGGVQSILKTAEKAAIIFRKNKVKRWDGSHYLAHITPEGLAQLRAEVEAKGVALSEPIKKELDGRTYEYYSYGDFYYSVTPHDLMYKNATTQYIIFMGKRGIDGTSPIDVAKLEGEEEIQLINNPLGSGVLIDEDGNISADDNKQQGSIAINMDGLGACVSDDLCILKCEFTISEVSFNMPEASRGFDVTGNKGMFVSMSGNYVEVAGDATDSHVTSVTPVGYAYQDQTTSKYYAVGSTIVEFDAVFGTGYEADTWTATYETNKNAEIVALLDGGAKALVRVPNNVVGALTVKVTSKATS